MAKTYGFEPDYAVPPGATLKEMLDDRGISQSEFAQRVGLAEKTVSQIIGGAAPITYETAASLELVLGAPASFWNAREAQYRNALLKAEQREQLEAGMEWTRSLPVQEIVNRGYIQGSVDKATLVRQLLRFFGVSTVEAWNQVWLKPQAQFRGGAAQGRKPGYVAAWLRMGELEAERIDCAPYSAAAFKAALVEARKLTTLRFGEFYPRLVELFAKAGVVFAVVREIAGASVSGVTKWLGKGNKALLLLSLKYKTDDQFWFSLFHEACHILKHSKKIVFFEDGKSSDDALEVEANKFAADILIPAQATAVFVQLRSKAAIVSFAASIGIAPGIVVGRLQHDGVLPHTHCVELKRKYQWGQNARKE